MRVVLDTNILLVSVSDRSPYHLIFKAFIEGRYSLCVTTEILDEYAEILSVYSSQFLATNTLETIENAPNAVFVQKIIPTPTNISLQNSIIIHFLQQIS